MPVSPTEALMAARWTSNAVAGTQDDLEKLIPLLAERDIFLAQETEFWREVVTTGLMRISVRDLLRLVGDDTLAVLSLAARRIDTSSDPEFLDHLAELLGQLMARAAGRADGLRDRQEAGV